MKTIETPKCFNSHKEFQEWRKMCVMTKLNPEMFCRDCTRQYQKEMIKAKRCAFPETRFVVDSEGAVFGTRAVDSIFKEEGKTSIA
jgi:hypothetical protein